MKKLAIIIALGLVFQYAVLPQLVDGGNAAMADASAAYHATKVVNK